MNKYLEYAINAGFVNPVIEGDNYKNRTLICNCSQCGKVIKFRYSCIKRRLTTICAECVSKSYRNTEEKVKENIEKHGCKLLSKYANSTFEKIDIECHCGKVFSKLYNDIAKTKKLQCDECRGIIPLDEYIKKIKDCGIDVINYVNRMEIYVRCPCGIIYKTDCQTCYNKKHKGFCKLCSDKMPHPETRQAKEQQLVNFLKCYGCELIDEYKTAHTKVRVKCKCGNIYFRKPNSILTGSKLCTNCTGFETFPETYLKTFFDNFGITFEEKNRKIIKPLELDYVIDKLAIEVNGAYYHSETMNKCKDYHLNKYNRTKEQGYQLIQFWDLEIVEKPKIVKSMILGKLNLAKRIFARKLKLVELTTKECYEFFQSNHISGNAKCNYSLALIDENKKIYCAASFGFSRFNKKYEWELIRFANLAGHSVIGGASRILKNFEKIKKPKSLITFADKRFSNGNLYKQLGFDYLRETQPCYWYFTNKTGILHRSLFQKHMLKDKLANFDENLSEYENMKLNGFHRIWDCGSFVFCKVYT